MDIALLWGLVWPLSWVLLWPLLWMDEMMTGVIFCSIWCGSWWCIESCDRRGWRVFGDDILVTSGTVGLFIRFVRVFFVVQNFACRPYISTKNQASLLKSQL